MITRPDRATLRHAIKLKRPVSGRAPEFISGMGIVDGRQLIMPDRDRMLFAQEQSQRKVV